MTTENNVPQPKPTGKRRGGQPGNQNARKHGYFSKVLDEKAQAALHQLPPATDALEAELRLQSLKMNSLLATDPFNERVVSAAGRRLVELQRTVALRHRLSTDEAFRQTMREWLSEYGIAANFPTIITPENRQPGTEKNENAENNEKSKEPKNESCLPETLPPNPHA